MDGATLLKDTGTHMDTGTLLTPNSRDGSTPSMSTYLAMSEDYLIMPELLNLKNIDVYELLFEDEKEKVNEIIAEAFARNYGLEGLNDFDYDIKGEIL